jgi:hypothetical protein
MSEMRPPLKPPFWKAHSTPIIIIVIVLLLLFSSLAILNGPMGEALTKSRCYFYMALGGNITEEQMWNYLAEWDYSPTIKKNRKDVTYFGFKPWCGEAGTPKQRASRSFIEEATIQLGTSQVENNIAIEAISKSFRGTKWSEEMELMGCVYSAVDRHLLNLSISNLHNISGGSSEHGCGVDNFPSWGIIPMKAVPAKGDT